MMRRPDVTGIHFGKQASPGSGSRTHACCKADSPEGLFREKLALLGADFIVFKC